MSDTERLQGGPVPDCGQADPGVPVQQEEEGGEVSTGERHSTSGNLSDLLFSTNISLIKESSFYQASNNIDLVSLEADIEKVLHKKFPDDHIPLDCLNGAISELKSNEKPGLNLLPERKKKLYVEDLMKKLSSTIKGNKEATIKDNFTKREVKALWARHLKDCIVPLRNSEFDILVTLKVNIVCI